MPAEYVRNSRPSTPFSCIPQILAHQAGRIPDAPAIMTPGRTTLTYGRLHQHIDEIGRTLRSKGIGPRDRVVVTLPNGPELAVAILAVESAAVCAPLNPTYGEEELKRYFSDLRPRAVITQAGIDSPARRTAVSLGIRVFDLSTEPDAPAGLFTLVGDPAGAPSHDAVAPGDVALLLPTSGTTSRPKVVPLTHANICTSAYAHCAALALEETDRCLHVLPLFHGHGLNGTLMPSLAAGASVVCIPAFNVNRFSAWLSAFQPTWYTAVPTIHQAILSHTRHSGERLADSRLRLVRVSSAPVLPRVFTELEQLFETSVIEFYGMTEVASSPITCDPLARGHKTGSVGARVGLDVAVMDDRGSLLPAGRTGQVVVRGASVMSGYVGNPEANQAAFADGWFKTGDLGFFDDDGYLFLVGRIKEIINRGGQKIAPQEVDDVFLDHPDVAEAVTFAVPHATLGEDVASAVVLRSHASATPQDIRQFAIGRIADFKVPRQVVVVSEIPKGPTGKVQRIGLAAKLGLTGDTSEPRAYAAPRTPLETMLAGHWAGILNLDRIGIHDDFFASGGDSLLASDVLSHVYQIAQVEFDVSRFFEGPTVAEVAQEIERATHAGRASRTSSAIVPVPRGNGAVPASVRQQRLHRLQHALPDIPFLNVLYPLRLTSHVDRAVLKRSIDEIVRRHEILRTTFAVIDDRYVQVIAPELPVPLSFDDLLELPKSKRDSVAQEIFQEEALHSFDLAKGPLLRARLVRLTEQDHLLLISMHQMICDGWSLGILVEELVTLYDAFANGNASPLAPLPIQYADFAQWQRRWQSHSEVAAQLAYWREQLREPLPALTLTASCAGRPLDGFITARREVAIPLGLVDAAIRFSHQEGGTLFMTLVSAFKTLLHCSSGQDDVRLATNVANRSRPLTDALIGPLVNTVILRTNLGGDPTPREVMRRVRTTTLAAFAHQELPFEELVQVLERERQVKPLPFANIMILLQNATLRSTARRGQSLDLEEVNPDTLVPLVTITSFDVILMLRQGPDGLRGTCVYKPHLFDAKFIDRLLREFQEVLERLTSQPDEPISAMRVSLTEQALDA